MSQPLIPTTSTPSGRVRITRKPQLPSRELLPPSARQPFKVSPFLSSGTTNTNNNIINAAAATTSGANIVRLPPIRFPPPSKKKQQTGHHHHDDDNSDINDRASNRDDATNDADESAQTPSSSSHHVVAPRAKLNQATLAAARARAQEQRKICFFDITEGCIEIKNHRNVDQNRLVAQIYKEYQHSDTLKKQFLQVVEQMSLARKKELAMETLARFHETQERAMLARKMLPECVSRHRSNILKHLKIEFTFGDLSKDTSTLSDVRIASAAVDALLFHEATKVADAEMKQRKALVMPDGMRPVDVLEMRLDAWRRKEVPFGPKTIFA